MSQLERFAERYELVPEVLRRWLVEAMVLGAAADGHIDRREMDEIAVLVSSQADFDDIEEGELHALLRVAVEGLRRDGFVPRVHALAGALSRYAHRVLAFRVATRVAFADGVVLEDEIGLLREMQRVFGISENDVARALDAAQAAGSSIPVDVEPVEAYLDVLMMGASVDGEVNDGEMAFIIAFILDRPELDALDGELLRGYIERNVTRFSSWDERRARIAELRDELPLAEHRQNAWSLALGVVMARGQAHDGEREFLSLMHAALQMDETLSVLAGDFDVEGGL